MPDIDLGPNDYKIRDPKTGRWHFTDDRKLAKSMLVVALAVLAFIFVSREQLTSGTLFGVTALFAAGAGIMFAIWLKDRY